MNRFIKTLFLFVFFLFPLVSNAFFGEVKNFFVDMYCSVGETFSLNFCEEPNIVPVKTISVQTQVETEAPTYDDSAEFEYTPREDFVQKDIVYKMSPVQERVIGGLTNQELEYRLELFRQSLQIPTQTRTEVVREIVRSGGGGSNSSSSSEDISDIMRDHLRSNYEQLSESISESVQLGDLSAGSGITYDATSGLIGNSGVLSIGGLTGAVATTSLGIISGGSIGDDVNSGTSGSLLFVDASGNLAQDNSNLFWNDTSNRLGIGTTTPEYVLQVHKDAGQTDLAITTNTNIGSANTATLQFISDNDGTQNLAMIGQYNDGSLRLSGGSSLVSPHMAITDAGYVGIGTSSPSQTLHVSNDSYLQALFSSSASMGGIGLRSSAGQQYEIQSTASGLLTYDRTGSANVLNSLLGRTTIYGTTYASLGINSTNRTYYLQADDTISSAFGIYDATASQYRMVVDIDGNVGVGTTSPSAKLAVSNTGSGNSFLVEDSTNPDTTPFVIDASGNVGIGATSPSTKLDIVGGFKANMTGTERFKLQYNGTDYFTVNYETPNAYTFKSPSNGYGSVVRIEAAGTGQLPLEIVDYTGATGSYFDIYGGLVSNNITNTGILSIGTTPIYTETPLVVTSSVRPYNPIATFYQGSGATGNATVWKTNAGTTISAITETGGAYFAGNVGIGTTSPSAKLAVTGSGTGTGRAFTIANSSNVDKFTVLDNGTVNASYGVLNLGPLSVFDGSTDNRLDITSSGGIRMLSNLYFGNTYDGGSPTISASSQDLVFGSNGAARAVVTSGGSLGIGTTTPSAKLSITQSANTAAGGLWITETGNTDFRSAYMDTSGVMSFYGGDTGGTLNTATLNAAGEWTNASDRAYKDNIEDLNYGLDAVLALQPRSYTIKETNVTRLGFIAQEMELVLPELVSGEEGKKGISYGNLTSVLVKAIQELSAKVDAMTANISEAVGDVFGWMRFRNEQLCVDDVCITKDQFKELLENNGGGSSNIFDVDPVEETPSEPEDEPVAEVVADVEIESIQVEETLPETLPEAPSESPEETVEEIPVEPATEPVEVEEEPVIIPEVNTGGEVLPN